MARVNNRQRLRSKRRAALPLRAERRYVGAARLWAKAFRSAVLSEIEGSNLPLVQDLRAHLFGHRTDAERGFLSFILGIGAKLIDGARRRLHLENPNIPLEQISNEVATTVRANQKRILGIRANEIVPEPTLQAWRKENVALVTRMQEEQLQKLASVLDKLGTDRVENIAGALEEEFGFTAARAERIARDQTLKLNAQLTEETHKAAGIDEYYWADVEDESVRDIHRELGDRSRNGERFRYDDPPVAGKYGETGNPGEIYNCRCQAIPYVPEFDGPD